MRFKILEPFNSSCNERNQSQRREDYLQSNGREGEDVFLREAMKIKLGSCSVGNFAVRLVQTIFLQEELVNRNCRGSQGKQGLNPSKLATVKDSIAQCTVRKYKGISGYLLIFMLRVNLYIN